MDGLIKGLMRKGQAWSVIWVILFMTSAAQPGAAEPAPAPKPKPGVAEKPSDQDHKPSRGGRASGATFYDVDGAVPVTWSKDEVVSAKAACPEQFNGIQLTYKPLAPIGGPEGCGTPAPIEVNAVAGIAIRPPATLNCKFAKILHRWARGAVQQAAQAALNDQIVSLDNVASYTCRARRGSGSGRLSEHALTNALDIAGFNLKSGRRVSVSDDWGPSTGETGVREEGERTQDEPLSPKATFLRYVHEAACEVFSTVLGPDHNALHKDHFHFDHGRGGRHGLCH